jgi:hypothetical protein
MVYTPLSCFHSSHLGNSDLNTQYSPYTLDDCIEYLPLHPVFIPRNVNLFIGPCSICEVGGDTEVPW